MAWEKVKLGDLYEVHNGLSKGGKFFGSGYPFLSFSTVFNNWFIPQNIKDLVQSTDKEQESYSIKKGDVFITRTSETADELGMSCVALKDYPQATYNGFCKRLRPIKSNYEINPRYIGYYLRTSDFRGKFLGLSGTMTTRASLRNEDLLAMEILLPPIKEQKRIADILSAYDDLIENNQKQIKLLEEAAQRLYKQWFIDLRFPGHETTPIVDGLPEGWRKECLGNLVPILTGKKDANYGTADGKYPFFTCSQEPVKSPGYSFDTSAVILAGNGDFNVKLYRGKFEAYQRTYVLAPKDKNYLYLVYNSVQGKMRELFQGASGSTIKFLTKGMIESIPIVIPSNLILKKFNDLQDAIQKKIEVLKTSIICSVESRDRLLPKLMNGMMHI